MSGADITRQFVSVFVRPQENDAATALARNIW